MRTTPSTAHRRGHRVDFLTPVQGPFAPWLEVIATAGGHSLEEAVGGAGVSVRRVDHDTGHAEELTLALNQAAGLVPDDLAEVRRPVSYAAMSNFIGRMVLPTEAREAHSGWVESRNERENFRDLLMSQPVTQMATQPMRIVWPFVGGVRSHVPDAVALGPGGRATMIDVTRRARLQDPAARAIFLLARATAERMGWNYQLRGELTPQHQRNVSFVYSHRHPPAGVEELHQRVRAMPSRQQVRDAARLFGSLRVPNYAAVWHLVATGRLFVDLTVPLEADSIVRVRPHHRRNPCLLTP